MKEIWKPISFTNGAYSVSSFGNVRRDVSGMNTYIGKILKNQYHSTGYHCVSICLQGVNKTYLVHKLLATEFLGKPKDGFEVNHKDGNKSNNYLGNLEYVTRGQNIRHAVKNKLFGDRNGENNSNSKLTVEEVLEIRSKYIKGNTHRS